MRIAVIANQYGALSETFVRREVEALQARGHECAVFVGLEAGHPRGAPATVPVQQWDYDALAGFRADVLYASLGQKAHQRAVVLARKLNIPFCLRAWQGYDFFAEANPSFYSEATADRLCVGVIVEDAFAERYAKDVMRCDAAKLHMVPNSVDVERFCPRDGDRGPGPVRILAVCRFVPKKGLLYLIRAFNRLRESLGDKVELLIVGYGEQEAMLREAAGPGVTIAPPIAEADLPALYQSADIFAAPCVQMPRGDADGVPTTVLEAKACGLVTVVSDLLSAREYERVWLMPPGDEAALCRALRGLVEHPEYRVEAGRIARAFAVEQLDIRTNIARIEAVLEQGRAQLWQSGIDEIQRRRANYRPGQQEQYDAMANDCLAALTVTGSVLDVGCGIGRLRNLMPAAVTSYHGVDAVPIPDEPAWFTRADAEALPFDRLQFDTVLSYSVLQHVLRPDRALTQALRVLKPGGRLALQVPVRDYNPIFLHWWQAPEVLRLVEDAGFRVESYQLVREKFLCVNAVKGV